jgi:hypothetical protein
MLLPQLLLQQIGPVFHHLQGALEALPRALGQVNLKLLLPNMGRGVSQIEMP